MEVDPVDAGSDDKSRIPRLVTPRFDIDMEADTPDAGSDDKSGLRGPLASALRHVSDADTIPTVNTADASVYDRDARHWPREMRPLSGQYADVVVAMRLPSERDLLRSSMQEVMMGRSMNSVSDIAEGGAHVIQDLSTLIAIRITIPDLTSLSSTPLKTSNSACASSASDSANILVQFNLPWQNWIGSSKSGSVLRKGGHLLHCKNYSCITCTCRDMKPIPLH